MTSLDTPDLPTTTSLEWAIGVAARHRDRHWCWGMDPIMGPGQRMFGGPVIGHDCDARNASLALVGALSEGTPEPGLDAAWNEAEAALPNDAYSWRVRSLVEIAFAPRRWEAVATNGKRVVKSDGHTPTAALQALAAALREQPEKETP